jgi:hypothetical protein
VKQLVIAGSADLLGLDVQPSHVWVHCDRKLLLVALVWRFEWLRIKFDPRPWILRFRLAQSDILCICAQASLATTHPVRDLSEARRDLPAMTLAGSEVAFRSLSGAVIVAPVVGDFASFALKPGERSLCSSHCSSRSSLATPCTSRRR